MTPQDFQTIRDIVREEVMTSESKLRLEIHQESTNLEERLEQRLDRSIDKKILASEKRLSAQIQQLSFDIADFISQSLIPIFDNHEVRIKNLEITGTLARDNSN